MSRTILATCLAVFLGTIPAFAAEKNSADKVDAISADKVEASGRHRGRDSDPCHAETGMEQAFGVGRRFSRRFMAARRRSRPSSCTRR